MLQAIIIICVLLAAIIWVGTRPQLVERRRLTLTSLSDQREIALPRSGHTRDEVWVSSQIVWEQTLFPTQAYALDYTDRTGESTRRIIELQRIGRYSGRKYLGVFEEGKFKTLRADRVSRIEQLSNEHPPAIALMPTLSDRLPGWHEARSPFKVPQLVGKRHWTVDLTHYSCTCPEGRVRRSSGYGPGTLGGVCPHLAKAIVANLPAEHDWDPELIRMLTEYEVLTVGDL